MQTTSGFYIDRNGEKKAGELVYVYLGSSLATIYEAGTTTAKANPFPSDATGAWSFTAANDDYIVYKIENGVISQITDTNTTYTTDYTGIERLQNGYFYMSEFPWAITAYFSYDGTFSRTANTGSLLMTRSINVNAGVTNSVNATGDASQIIYIPSTFSGTPIMSLYGYRSYTLTGTGAVLNSFTASISVYTQRLDDGSSESLAGSVSIPIDSTWTNLSIDLSATLVPGATYGVRVHGDSVLDITGGSTVATGVSNVWLDDVSMLF